MSDKTNQEEQEEQEDSMIEVSPVELEFAFAQAARFGAFIYFNYAHEDLCKKIFSKHNGSPVDTMEEIDEMDEDDKKKALVEIAFQFMKKKASRKAESHFSRLYHDKMVWEHIEVLNIICNQARKGSQ